MNTKNSSWSGPPSLSESYGVALCRIDRRHQQSGGVNIKNSSWREREADLQQPAVAQKLWRGALQKGAECQQSGGAWDAGVLAHGHNRERVQLAARWRRLVRRAPKAKCHLSPRPSLPQPKRAGGCLRTGVSTRGTIGEGLLRLVRVKRLEAAWALGCSAVMDMVDGMESRGQKDEGLYLAQGADGHKRARKCTERHENAQNFTRVFFLAGSRECGCVSADLAKKGVAEADESRLFPLCPAKHLVCEKIYFSAQGVLADCHHADGSRCASHKAARDAGRPGDGYTSLQPVPRAGLSESHGGQVDRKLRSRACGTLQGKRDVSKPAFAGVATL
jgi:hypothetical protein